MSAGTQNRVIRMDDALWVEIQATVARRNFWTRRKKWTMSDFIRIACDEKMEKMRRSRQRTKGRKNAAVDQEIADLESVRPEFLAETLEDGGAIS